MHRRLTLAETDALAAEAHAGQTDRIGVPYVEHVRAVARGLAPISERLAQAGLLHDVVEDTEWTLDGLLAAGVPAEVVALVDAVTNRPGVPYEAMIRSIVEAAEAGDEEVALLKIADNAHNSHPDRTAALPAGDRKRLEAKYRAARRLLWPTVGRDQLEAVVRRVNPSLLDRSGD
ncbi:HD domain-containing protein [Streptomyces sp. H27-D2]|uniref:HD domain-containing protein n=1 Tax=Streptomyces sp. H27-D2 TaxID=3046304 RepID=UPI002DBDEA6A|nr:HD domain-containing protein [Streptomyces sp. H27-D2]MEC4015948.1 HD domain-containing protein [Streptomyces sp. H27-D2]